MLLAISLVAPTVGTTRKDLFCKEGIEHDVRRAMDDLWRPNQAEIDRCVDGALILTISRSVVKSSGEILNWVGISKRSPFSPDHREGNVVGIGTFFTGSAEAEPLYNLLSDGFNNYMNFINYYKPGNYRGFVLSNMRLDRIKLTQNYLDDLSNSITKRSSPRPVSEKKGYLVRPFSGSLDSFQEVYAFAQNHGDFSRIVVSADPHVFLRSSLKELQFVKPTEEKTPDTPLQIEPQQTDCKDAPKISPKKNFPSAAAATLIPVTEQITLSGIEALINLAAQQGPEGVLARSSLERIRKKLGAAEYPTRHPK